MEQWIRNARLGQEGDADALKDLGLEDVKPVQHNIIKESKLDDLRRHFQMVGEVSLAARLIGHTALQETCELMLGLVHYVAAIKLNENLIFSWRRDNIRDAMATFVSSMKAFLNSVGETNGLGDLQKMKQLIQKAKYGDKYAIAFFTLEIAFFTLDEIPPLQVQAVKKVPRFYKLLNLYQCYQTYAQVVMLVKNPTFTYVAKGACAYIVWMASKTKPTETLVSMVDGSDICTSLLAELEFIDGSVKHCQRKLFKYQGERLKDEVQEMEEEVGDPSYQPEEEGENSELSEASKPMEDEPTSKAASSSKQPKKPTKKFKEEKKKCKKTNPNPTPRPPAKKARLANVTASATTTCSGSDSG